MQEKVDGLEVELELRHLENKKRGAGNDKQQAEMLRK